MLKKPFNNFFRGRVPRKEREHLLNEEIEAAEVRLVGENVENGVYPIAKALELSEQLALDLILIVDKAIPPVCRIYEYSKYLYEQKKHQKELDAKSKRVVTKEVQLSPTIDDNDFNFKAKHAQEFLEKGSKVKIILIFKGRAIIYKEKGQELLLNFVKLLDEYGKPEQMPRLEGKRMMVTIAPKNVK